MTTTNLVTDVVRAVATADGVDPTDVEPLHEYIDPDALARLERQDGGEWQLSFRYADHQVTVTHESRVLVDGVADTSHAPR